MDVPLYNNESIQHIGGAVTVDPKDNKIFFTTGDGRGCEYDEDCNSKMASIRESVEPAGSGGIFLQKENRDELFYKGTNEYKFHQYASGIRNSFGPDFDPVNGNLWDTENGPAFGDEINLV